MTADTAVLVAFAAYVGVVFIIGAAAYRRTNDLADYLLGGRRISPTAAALSAGASDMSGWLLLGLPGLAYVSGSAAAWTAAGLMAGTYLNWRLVARRLRVYSARCGNALTIPEYLERRFDDHSHVLRVVAALTILGFFLFYTSAGFVAGGKLFATVFGVSYETAVVGSAAMIVLYTCFGGFLAVVWTDVLQALLMVGALMFVAAVTVSGLAETGFDGPPGGAPATGAGALAIVSALAWGLGYAGQPHILTRFMALGTPARMHRARRIAVAWTALSPENGVLDLVAYAWAGFGASLGPCILLSLYWRGMTRRGALAGVIAGAVAITVWSRLSGGWFDVYALLPGFLFSAAIIFVVSRTG